jgi:two-component system, LuxR family, sensor histidine kinase DctS
LKFSLGAGRWWLWSALCVLLLLLLGVLVFLARAYEDSRLTTELERTASELVAEIKDDLSRNALAFSALHQSNPDEASWMRASGTLLLENREILRTEWRDSDLRIRLAQVSPFLPFLFEGQQRAQALPDVQQACVNARRYNSPAYSTSYFLPLQEGRGQEVLEMCLQLPDDAGYLVLTYSMSGLLAERVGRETRGSMNVALTDSDGTRLAIAGRPLQRQSLQAVQLLELPGSAYTLRLQQSRDLASLRPKALSSTLTLLVVVLAGVLALLAFDVRKRLRTEAKLAEALAFRKAMEDSLLTGLRARDMTGRITYVNPAFCRLVDLPPERLIGTSNPAPFWPPERVDEYMRQNARLHTSLSEPRQGFEVEYMRPDGTRLPVWIVEAPLIDAQGRQTGWMSSVLDLSAQRKIEEQSRASQERLAATARLAMAGEMASLISHELNQPLAAIANYANGSLNLLQGDGQDLPAIQSDLEEAIRRMAAQAERAGKVIRSVSDLVRRRERERRAVTPQSLFDGIAPLVQLQARKTGIEVRWQVEPDCPAAWCDPTMVEQVLLNLVRNGLQAMPAGDPPAASGLRTLELQASAAGPLEGSQRERILFTVTDHGQGLSNEVAARLFTPFFTTKPEGMGLGLSLCRTVVEQHGGTLDHEPGLPRGTVFRFTLPAAL